MTHLEPRLCDAASAFVSLDDGADRVVGVLELRVVPVEVLQLALREAVLVDGRRLCAAGFLLKRTRENK